MIEQYVTNCLQLAMLLEVSAYPKPGNVHRTAGYDDTKFEHFLASTVAVGEQFRNSAKKGILVSKGRIGFEKIRIGKIIKDAVQSMLDWQSSGNTSLGIILLFVPMAIAGGAVLEKSKFSLEGLRQSIKKIVRTTTCDDAIKTYEAINLARPGGLGKVKKYDLKMESISNEIQKDNLSLFDIFKISSSYDSVAREWVKNYSITFDIGYPYFDDCIKKDLSVNEAIVQTFLKILSTVPDSLILRKFGLSKAEEISFRAKKILERGGIITERGKKELILFDRLLRNNKNKINPGTTADLTASTLAISILNGYRP
ncbi:hypothetical protein AC481_05120 [miscellaneous Crenarchaeota group archaeon SMTZ-80]|nr:MAG: hypothetical protein AC481_05120 [miscellaneous Crenarchaeota group archaeon SMTZ-80]